MQHFRGLGCTFGVWVQHFRELGSALSGFGFRGQHIRDSNFGVTAISGFRFRVQYCRVSGSGLLFRVLGFRFSTFGIRGSESQHFRVSGSVLSGLGFLEVYRRGGEASSLENLREECGEASRRE